MKVTLTISMPYDLAMYLAEKAEKEDITMNQQVVKILTDLQQKETVAEKERNKEKRKRGI